MGNEPISKHNGSFESQVTQIQGIADQIREYLHKTSRTLPASLVEKFNALDYSLDQLKRQVVQRDRANENLIGMVGIGQIINSTLQLNEVLRIVMDTIVRLSNAERGFLMLRDDQGNLSIRIARNWIQESIDPSEFAISRTVVNRVIHEGQAVLTTNAQEDPRFGGHESIVAYNLRSILCVPLILKDETIGAIYADNRIRSGIFTENELHVLSALANQAAVAIENARLFESVRSTLAEVTELKNLMDNVFSSIASGVITADVDDRITMCNRAAARILGCSHTDLVGIDIDHIFPSHQADLVRHLESVWQTDQTIVGVELNSHIPERGPISLSLNISPLKDADQVTQGVAIVLDDLTEKRKLEAQYRLFERMVSPAVIEQLNPDKLQLGGKRAEITTLFADVRGYTHFSELLPPEHLVIILNRYLASAADAIMLYEGTIDKFQGDAVMAWFNAPIQQVDHVLRAVQAALAIQKGVERLKKEIPPDYQLAMGIGIHFGEAILGLVGTEKRLDYTAIGDSINTAKRIQENALAGQILISSEAFAKIANRVLARKVSAIRAKGKSQPLDVYEILGLAGPTNRF